MQTIEAIAQKSKRVRLLSSSAWLIPLQDEAHIAQELCSAMRKDGFQYEILFCGPIPRQIHEAIDPFA
ncbi:MAG: hypothetical protein DME22_23050 [Verrucomicrobia bacterium]|nr:MAG: hypothetical protein DME22_23050 [Verrucomicrobiota bacterium]